jgi:peptidoglycan/LPS O-acetylase OafA/YrhL
VGAPDSIPALDGIRAIAIALVCLAHGGCKDLVPGGLGVTVFFVLSGFLITTLMRIEYAARGTLDLPAFYLRRVFRLMPPLLIVVLATVILDAAGRPHAAATPAGVASVIFYFSNYYSIFVGDGVPDGLGVTWSLAIEEHFYIVFPLLALLLLRLRRPVSAAAIGALCLGILMWRCWLIAHGATVERIYMGTDTRIDSILVGCAMAVLCNPALDPVHERVGRCALPVCALALAVLAATLALRGEYFRNTFRYTVQALALAPLIYCAVAGPRQPAFRWLNAAPLVYLGRISYTVYLTHEGCRHFLGERWPTLGMVPTMAATALLTVAIAALMRRWVEIPFAGMRQHLHQRHARAPVLPGGGLVRTDR